MYYVAQVDEVDPIALADLGDRRRDHELVIQLASNPGERFLPIVVARDERGGIVGMGVYNPPALFDANATPGFVENDHVQTRVYPITLEPTSTIAADPRKGQPASTVFAATCAEQDAPSGLVWRHASGAQLRLLLSESPGPSKAEKLLEAPDLDCDTHAAGILVPEEVGVPRDCDDLDAGVRPGAPELCNGYDDDCDEELDAVVATTTCGGCRAAIAGVCDESLAPSQGGESCLVPMGNLRCVFCALDFTTEAGAGGDMIGVCGGAAKSVVDGCGPMGCTATLLDVAPGWTVSIGSSAQALVGVGAPVVIAPVDGTTILYFHASAGNLSFAAEELNFGHFTVHFQPVDRSAAFAWTYQLGRAAQNIGCTSTTVDHVRCAPNGSP